MNSGYVFGPNGVVILGAGRLGQRVAEKLQCENVRLLAFCDNFGEGVRNGLPILKPDEACRRYPEATYIIAIWHPSLVDSMAKFTGQLEELGARHVLPFSAVAPECGGFFWAEPELYQREASLISEARALLDDTGREEFDRQLRFRQGELSALAAPRESQYLLADAVALSSEEYFVDCGAYDGDTLGEFITATSGRFRHYLALEPDPSNFGILNDKLARLGLGGKVSARALAVGDHREQVRFATEGSSSGFSSGGGITVECVTLDELLLHDIPTYIKMDIEGAEDSALRGAKSTIRRCRPKLAICIYHRPRDLWAIPLLVHEIEPRYRMTLRSHAMDGFECVCYCTAQG